MPVPFPPLSLDNLFAPPTADDWMTTLLNMAKAIGLPTTTWEAGGVERAMLATFSQALQQEGVSGSIIAQAGFLDFAATGTVTYTDATGAVVTLYVTPDPSIPAQNPTGALGWLDVLADSVYDVRRLLSAPAGGGEAIVNTSVTTYGPFAAGTYHVAQPSAPGSPGYTNASSLSIPPSVVVGSLSAPGATNVGGAINLHVIAHGLLTGATVFALAVGGTTEAIGAWTITKIDADNFTLDGSVFVHAWTAGGTVYTPTVAAFVADSSGTASNANPRTITQPVTSLIGVTVGNPGSFVGSDVEGNVACAARCRLKLQSVSPNGPKGAYAYYALTAFVIGPTLNPPHPLSTPVNRALVQGGAGSVTTTIANALGAPVSGDVNSTDAVIQAFAVPASDTETTVAAANHAVTVALKAWVRTSDVSRFAAVAQVATQLFFRMLPIGGVTNTSGGAPNTNVVPYDAWLGAISVACAAASIVVQQLEGTLNGSAANVQLLLGPPVEVATLANPTFTPTVTGV